MAQNKLRLEEKKQALRSLSPRCNYDQRLPQGTVVTIVQSINGEERRIDDKVEAKQGMPLRDFLSLMFSLRCGTLSITADNVHSKVKKLRGEGFVFKRVVSDPVPSSLKEK